MKVLLANDASDQAEHATRFLRRFPHIDQLELTVLTSFEIPMYALNETSADWIVDFEDIAKEGADHVRAKTQQIFKDTGAHLTFIRVEGHAGNEIVEYAKRNRFDLIVLGATGHSMLSRILLGSVSDYVATHADGSVLIVRPPEKSKPEGQNLSVTIGYDGSAPSRAAIDELSRVFWGAKIDVHLVHAAQSLYAYRERMQSTDSEADSLRKSTSLEHLKAVAKQLPFTDPDPRVHLFEADHLGQSIIDLASRAECDMIMLGDKGRSAIDRMLLGSVSRYILRHAPMSVWISRKKLR